MLEGWVLGLHLLSAHPGQTGMNNVNPGVYLVSPKGYTVGGYRNSEDRNSMYVGKSWQYGRFSVTAAAVTGYRRHGIVPAVVGSFSLGGGFRLSGAPAPHGAVFHLSWETSL